MNRIFLILALLVAAVLGASWYVHRAKTRAMNSGDVFVREQPGDNAKPPAAPAPAASQPAQPQEVATANEAQSPQAAAIPASDTINRNPPNGTPFTGSGRFQLYRQGDITWRLNTETGDACILFATDSQWARTRVYQHGCGVAGESSTARGN